MKRFQNWQVFALGSAVIAVLTAILGRLGVAEINSSLATFLMLSGIATGLSWLCYYHALRLGPVRAIAHRRFNPHFETP